MKNRILAAALTLSAMFATGCVGFERKSSLTGPDAAGTNAFSGSWTSSSLIPSPSACSDFQWDVTEQTATTAKGKFTAKCAGDLNLTGTAQGSLNSPVSLTWSAAGNATAPGLTSCAITLTGTAELQVDSIRIPYSGDTCLGKVSGIESLKKR
jgi:hypothetical protein